MKSVISDVTTENLRNKIESNQRFTFLLKAKVAQLRKEIAKVEEIIDRAKTLTPVEEIKDTDEKEIMVDSLLFFSNEHSPSLLFRFIQGNFKHLRPETRNAHKKTERKR